MAKTVNIFGKTFIIREFKAERYKKQWTLATPPPWFGNRDKLSDAQKLMNTIFGQIASATKGMKWEARKKIFQDKLKNFRTGMAKERIVIRAPALPSVIAELRAKGIRIPTLRDFGLEELEPRLPETVKRALRGEYVAPVAVVPTPGGAPPAIRE